MKKLLPALLTGLCVLASLTSPALAAQSYPITATASNYAPTYGSLISIKGRVAGGAIRNNEVQLQRQVSGQWKLQKRVQLASQGLYSLNVKVPVASVVLYRLKARAGSGAVLVSRNFTLRPVEPGRASLSEARALILKETNEYRSLNNLPPLTVMEGLNDVAQYWSQRQAEAQVMDHNPNFSNLYPAGFTQAGENVARGYTHTMVTAAWYSSPGHRDNMLSDYTHIGIGMAYDINGEPYYTQNFAKY